jgi:hypothetical protein
MMSVWLASYRPVPFNVQPFFLVKPLFLGDKNGRLAGQAEKGDLELDRAGVALFVFAGAAADRQQCQATHRQQRGTKDHQGPAWGREILYIHFTISKEGHTDLTPES